MMSLIQQLQLASGQLAIPPVPSQKLAAETRQSQSEEAYRQAFIRLNLEGDTKQVAAILGYSQEGVSTQLRRLECRNLVAKVGFRKGLRGGNKTIIWRWVENAEDTKLSEAD